MRWVGWLLAMILAAAWFASELPSQGRSGPSQQELQWRRTRLGWAHIRQLHPPQSLRAPLLHPALVATAQVVLCVAALVALGPRPGCRSARSRAWSTNPEDEGGTLHCFERFSRLHGVSRGESGPACTETAERGHQ
jgi:hypothetical protein